MCIRDRFLSPCAIRVQRAHGCHHMKMRVRDAAVLCLRAVKSKVGNHAFCHKLLLDVYKRQVYLIEVLYFKKNVVFFLYYWKN